MTRFFTWLLRNRLLVLACGAALGRRSARSPGPACPSTPSPTSPTPRSMILTKAPGLAAVDVEQRVSYPIEQVMGGLPRVQQVRSLSKAGLSQVVVVFEDGVDTYWTRQVVFERLAGAREELPPGVEPELGADQHRPGRDLPVHARGREATRRWSCARSRTGWSRRCSSHPRRHRGQQLRRRGQAVPGARSPRPAAQVRPDPPRRRRGGRAQQRQRRRRRHRARAGSRSTCAASGLLTDIPDIERIVLKAKDGAPVYLRTWPTWSSAPSPARARSPATARARRWPAWSSCSRARTPKDVVGGQGGRRRGCSSSLPRACGSTSSTTAPRSSRRASRRSPTRSSRAASSSSSCCSSSWPSCAPR